MNVFEFAWSSTRCWALEDRFECSPGTHVPFRAVGVQSQRQQMARNRGGWPFFGPRSWGIMGDSHPNTHKKTSNQSKQRFLEIPRFFSWLSDWWLTWLTDLLIDWPFHWLANWRTEELKPWQHRWVVLPRRACRRSRNCGWRLSKRPGGYEWICCSQLMAPMGYPWGIHDLVDRRPLRKTPGWNCWGDTKLLKR